MEEPNASLISASVLSGSSAAVAASIATFTNSVTLQFQDFLIIA
jgi:hypothetical protein